MFIDICQKMIDALRQKRVLPGTSVRGIRTIYEANIAELAPYLTLRERNLLHVVHERMRVAEELMGAHLADIRDEVRGGHVADPWAPSIAMLNDQIRSFQLVELLLRSYIGGKPEDVFYVESKGGAGPLAQGSGVTLDAAVTMIPATHDAARHFLRIARVARQALHGIDAKIGNTSAFETVGPRALRPDLQSLQRSIQDFRASEARVIELRHPGLESRLSDAFVAVERQCLLADREVAQYERPDMGGNVHAHHFRHLAESSRSHVARLDSVTVELEGLTSEVAAPRA
jgi:hypothetical protein